MDPLYGNTGCLVPSHRFSPSLFNSLTKYQIPFGGGKERTKVFLKTKNCEGNSICAFFLGGGLLIFGRRGRVQSIKINGNSFNSKPYVITLAII